MDTTKDDRQVLHLSERREAEDKEKNTTLRLKTSTFSLPDDTSPLPPPTAGSKTRISIQKLYHKESSPQKEREEKISDDGDNTIRNKGDENCITEDDSEFKYPPKHTPEEAKVLKHQPSPLVCGINAAAAASGRKPSKKTTMPTHSSGQVDY